ncbi:hypothetical protein EHI88_07290 [Cronobacter malonaticus]|nr:hypothetical protein [Cronobacter malonaticus]
MNTRLFTPARTYVLRQRNAAYGCGVRGGKKFFFGFIVHTVHPPLLPFIFSWLSGEQKVKGEQCTVHHLGSQIKKDRRLPVW